MRREFHVRFCESPGVRFPRATRLGLSPPEIERPPPDIRYVPVDDEGRELEGVVAEEPSAP